jgi:hypothetical protein
MAESSVPASPNPLKPPDLMDVVKQTGEVLGSSVEISNKIYYNLWIVFLGGFVLSLHTPSGISRHVFWAVVIFRLLAMLGTVVNFFVQSLYSKVQFHVRIAAVLLQAHEVADYRTQMEEAKKQSIRADRLGRYSAAICGLFLMLGFVLSCLIQVPAN